MRYNILIILILITAGCIESPQSKTIILPGKQAIVLSNNPEDNRNSCDINVQNFTVIFREKLNTTNSIANLSLEDVQILNDANDKILFSCDIQISNAYRNNSITFHNLIMIKGKT